MLSEASKQCQRRSDGGTSKHNYLCCRTSFSVCDAARCEPGPREPTACFLASVFRPLHADACDGFGSIVEHETPSTTRNQEFNKRAAHYADEVRARQTTRGGRHLSA